MLCGSEGVIADTFGNEYFNEPGTALYGISTWAGQVPPNNSAGRWIYAVGSNDRIVEDAPFFELPSLQGGVGDNYDRSISVELNTNGINDAPIDTYEIYRSVSPLHHGQLICQIKPNGGGVYSYYDTLQFAQEYNYWVRAMWHGRDKWYYLGNIFGPYYCDSLPPLATPSNITALDKPYDNGNTIVLNWNGAPAANGYYIARKRAGETSFNPLTIAANSTFYDNSAQNGVSYVYAIAAYSDNPLNASAYDTSIVVVSSDNLAPEQMSAPIGYYDAGSKYLTLNWQPCTDEPNFGGYWVCPEPVGEFAGKPSSKYTVNHAAPIDRTTWSYRVPDDLIGQTLQMHVTAMDRSGNIGDWSPYVQINTKVLTNSNTLLATAYNNGRHLIYDGLGKLHLTYTTGDSVLYQKSWDDGYSWTPTSGLMAGGTNPSSVIGIYGADTTMVRKAETPLSGWVLKVTKRDNRIITKWTEPTIILEAPGAYDNLSTITPPSMAVNASGTHLVLESTNSGHSGVSYVWSWVLLYGFRPAGGTAFTWTTLDSASGSGGIIENPASPTICIDSKGGIHVAWDYDGEIYWRIYDPYSGAWKNKVNLSYSPDVVSEEPSLAFYGDVHIVWQEGNDIYHNKGNWGLPTAKSKIIVYPFSWQGAEIVNDDSPTTASINPVFDGNYIAWSEETVPGQYSAFYSQYTDYAWSEPFDYSSNPTQPSVYPQIAYRQNADGNKMTTVWTEGTGPLYSLIARDQEGQVTPQLAADVGGTEPSIYTIERDGYLVYNTTKSKTPVLNGAEGTRITVDYDSTELLYYLPTLDREQKQTVKISLYQEYTDKADYIYQIWVDDVSLGAVKVPSGQIVTFEKDLPNAVSHDGEGVLKIINLKKGAIVTCDKYELFAYDKATGKKNDNGAAQSEMSEAKPVAYHYELMQNAPNPCSKQTMINYQLAKQGQVSLKVYNTLGQVVKTLVNGSQNPGPYSVKWNGRDEAGRQAAAGIYFYRLSSGEFNSTKKMVVLR